MRRSGLPVLAFVLAACSGGDTPPPLELQTLNAGRAAIAARLARARPAARPPLTRAALDTLTGAFLEVTLERRDQLAYLHVNAQRPDTGPDGGVLTIWRTDDNITLTTRNGVLIATRGLGGDVLSSLVQVAGSVPGPVRGGEKTLDIRALDNKAIRLSLVCDLADLGPEPVVIVEHRHPTRHLRETCTGGTGRVINDYWVDAGEGLVWQSRQWAGPGIGYLRLRRLTR